jgi:hypothetical protein
MKFEAAATTPGRAKRYQNGTEPSAKSTHVVPLVGKPQASAACAGWAVPAKSAIAVTPAGTSFLTAGMLAGASSRPDLALSDLAGDDGGVFAHTDQER